ncbi:hypothetical protein BDV97DRAFT_377829 [Delphinella strobiligena]|nr:hypothetical protein BDV97DRAFT_377829 [Delphinella strobiligena]
MFDAQEEDICGGGPRGRLVMFTGMKQTGVSPFILVPSVFVGLLLGHWIHKCLLMVLFQNKIIYMPSLPPGSRREKLTDYSKSWGPVSWEERKITSLDGTKLAVAIGQVKEKPDLSPRVMEKQRKQRVILYFQGNGASLPPRTPMLSNVLKSVAVKSEDEWTLIGLSYRGYWTSSGRAHQKGIEKDAEALVNRAIETYASRTRDIDLIVWGQSIGAGVASFATAKYIEKQDGAKDDVMNTPQISRLILETPFVSIKSMLAALYPDWWVPYRHLWPFLRSWWDSEEALQKIATAKRPPKVLLMIASRDEIVPEIQADQLEKLCQHLKLDTQRENILGALHTQASTLERGKNAIVTFLNSTNPR